ncbi:unnamed protein product [Lactuca saligna]|uniref:Replication factor A C-terminal domain-containing protein n=1 Tax=Lactuca saligna TaxID=75948 RepID=A0AA35YVI4_LACSI|nr:unnamed protein product [Lactuca saligna]
MNKLVSENGQQLSSSGIKMMASQQDTEHDDFLKNNMFSNIDDLFEPLEEKTVVIVGTVKGIRQNICWYYIACSNCKKSPKQKESSTDKVDGSLEVPEIVTYECANPNCKSIKISVIPRDKSTATSPTKLISTPTEWKRNLATCIDLDEMENLSASKSA